jgi:hypothetical protein
LNSTVRDIEAAGQRVEVIRRRMLRPTPEALDDCHADLESAIAAMHRVESALQWDPETPQNARAELDQFRRNLAQVNALVKNAARFYSGWARLTSPPEDAANYTSGGKAAASDLEMKASGLESKLVLHG